MLQYGEVAVHEWSLRDYQTTQDVVEAAKNISRQEGRETRTAYAIHMGWYVCQSPTLCSNWPESLSVTLRLLSIPLSLLIPLFLRPLPSQHVSRGKDIEGGRHVTQH